MDPHRKQVKARVTAPCESSLALTWRAAWNVEGTASILSSAAEFYLFLDKTKLLSLDFSISFHEVKVLDKGLKLVLRRPWDIALFERA